MEITKKVNRSNITDILLLSFNTYILFLYIDFYLSY